MEDFSGFINEEIFLIDQIEKASTELQAKELAEKNETEQLITNYKVGIVAPNADQEDKDLLYKILGAISIQPRESYVAERISSEIGTWIVFMESLDSIQKELEHFTISELDGATIITSKSLGKLRESVEDKGKLWGLLKEHFKA